MYINSLAWCGMCHAGFIKRRVTALWSRHWTVHYSRLMQVWEDMSKGKSKWYSNPPRNRSVLSTSHCGGKNTKAPEVRVCCSFSVAPLSPPAEMRCFLTIQDPWGGSGNYSCNEVNSHCIQNEDLIAANDSFCITLWKGALTAPAKYKGLHCNYVSLQNNLPFSVPWK